jgi:acetyl esterase/lipase
LPRTLSTFDTLKAQSLFMQTLIHPLLMLTLVTMFVTSTLNAAEPQVINLWPGQPPGETKELPPEVDTTKPTDNLIDGRRLMRIGNVSTPTLTVYPAPADQATGASVVICPGGGHHILAWDLEGTEVAEWLNSIGVTAFVLKYRVPSRAEGGNEPRWRAAVQDAQRALSLVRSRAKEFAIDPERMGIMGFSAVFEDRTYDHRDAAEEMPQRPAFAGLIYAAGVVDRETRVKHDYVKITTNTPPMFIVHTYDDFVPVENPLVIFQELKRAGVYAELHIYSEGGHGYGLRETHQPVTTWQHRMADWMRVKGWLK